MSDLRIKNVIRKRRKEWAIKKEIYILTQEKKKKLRA